MIGQSSARRSWAVATALSIGLHLLGLGVYLRHDLWPPGADDPGPPQLQVTALPQIGLPQTAQSPVLQPVTAPVASAEPTVPVQGIGAAPATAAPLLTNNALPVLPGPPASPKPVDDGAAPPEPLPDTDADADPRLTKLFQRIRDRLTAPCLLALPALDGQGGIRLNLLASDDAQIPGLLRDLTAGLGADVQGQAVLLDPRQCPALAFARRDQRYPVFPLGITLQSQDVPTGGNLRGTISGAGGRQVTLLLVDDNGVTHDLRRFLVNSGGALQFDLPIARSDAGRDTQQVLIAVATPRRLASVSAAAGELAQDFFDQLLAETGPQALIGVTSVYVRPKS